MCRFMSSSWNQITGKPYHGCRKDCGTRSFNLPVGATGATYPCILTTVNPGLVNYTQACLPQQPYSMSGSSSNDARLDPVLHQLFQIPPTRIDWNHRDGVLSWSHVRTDDRLVGHPIVAAQPQRSPPVVAQQLPPTMPATPVTRPTNFHSADKIAIHPLLTSNTDCYHLPVLEFDVSKPPTGARVLTNADCYVALPQDRTLITDISPIKPCHCVLTFDNEALGTHVLDIPNLTLEDFFWALFEYFDNPLSDSERGRLQSSRAQYERAVEAMSRRCSTASDPEQEWSRGIKRVDCLEKGTWFRRMQALGESDDEPAGDAWFRVSFMQRAW